MAPLSSRDSISTYSLHLMCVTSVVVIVVINITYSSTVTVVVVVVVVVASSLLHKCRGNTERTQPGECFNRWKDVLLESRHALSASSNDWRVG